MDTGGVKRRKARVSKGFKLLCNEDAKSQIFAKDDIVTIVSSYDNTHHIILYKRRKHYVPNDAFQRNFDILETVNG